MFNPPRETGALLKPQVYLLTIIAQERMFWSLFVFRGRHYGNLYQSSVTTSRVTHLFCGPTLEPALVTANTGKTQDRCFFFCFFVFVGGGGRKRKGGEWPEKVKIIFGEEIPGVG